MSTAAFAELTRLLGGSPREGLLWLLVALVPWLSTFLLRAYRGAGSAWYRSSLYATLAAAAFWLFNLATLVDVDVQAGVNAWFVLFLYYFVPVWLLLWSVLGVSVLAFRTLARGKRTQEEEHTDSGE